MVRFGLLIAAFALAGCGDAGNAELTTKLVTQCQQESGREESQCQCMVGKLIAEAGGDLVSKMAASFEAEEGGDAPSVEISEQEMETFSTARQSAMAACNAS